MGNEGERQEQGIKKRGKGVTNGREDGKKSRKRKGEGMEMKVAKDYVGKR